MKRSPRRPAKSADFDKKRRQIMESVLVQVPFDGWTEAALNAGLRSAGAGRKESADFFPAGIADVVEAFGAMVDQAMHDRVEAERGFARMRVRDKVAFAVRARFETLVPYREAMKRLPVWYAMPSHARQGITRIYRTVDTIWRAAGDASTDYNFYTKRLLLAGVMKVTMIYWLNDDTPHCAATWEFLDRRINEIVRAGKGLGLLKEWKPSELMEMLRVRLKRAA